jgi:transcription elongation factor Elf1
LGGGRAVGAHAAVEALLVRLGHVEVRQRLAEAPCRVCALRLGVELAERLVALDAYLDTAEEVLEGWARSNGAWEN